MANEQQLRTIAQHVHCTREALRQEQIRLLAHLRTTEVQMEKAARFFTEHPELDTEAPARWEDLTNYEQVITLTPRWAMSTRPFR